MLTTSTLPNAPTINDAPFNLQKILSMNNQKPNKDYIKWIATSLYSIDIDDRIRNALQLEELKRKYNLTTEEAIAALKENMNALCTVENYDFKKNALIKPKPIIKSEPTVDKTIDSMLDEISIPNVENIDNESFETGKQLIEYIKNNRHDSQYNYDITGNLYKKVEFIYNDFKYTTIDNNTYELFNPVKTFNQNLLLQDINNNRLYIPKYEFGFICNGIFKNDVSKQKILDLLKLFEQYNKTIDSGLDTYTITVSNIPIELGSTFVIARLIAYNWMYLYSMNNQLYLLLTIKGLNNIHKVIKYNNLNEKYDMELVPFIKYDEEMKIIDQENNIFIRYFY